MSSHRAKKMSTSKHQRECHKFLTSAGYAWVKTDSHEHNHYHHHADRAMGMNHIIVTVSSPYSDSEGLKRVRDEIKRHDREREAHVAARAGGQIVSNAQIYANMADAYLLRNQPDDRLSRGARGSAFTGWVKRVVEKHGPVMSADLNEAAALIGFNDASSVRQAKLDIGIVSYRTKGQDTRWWSAMPYQAPDEFKIRKGNKPDNVGVEAVAPDPNLQVPSPALVEATSPPPADDTRAAALMLLESLGVKAPGAEAREALVAMQESLRAAGAALVEAGRTLDAAIETLS